MAAWAPLLLAATVLAGCGGGGGGGGGGGSPAISVSSQSLGFGAWAPGTTSTPQTITVTNVGSAMLTVSSVAISGADPAAFGDTSTCGSVAPNASCSIDVSFAPSASGPDSAMLDINSNVAGSPTTVALTGTGSATGANTAGLVIDQGPLPVSNPTINILYTSIQICAPGTATCQTIDHIQVDTGSWGVRVLSAAITNAQLAAALTPVPVGVVAGHYLVECAQFADGYSWGPIKAADVTIGGETASNLRIQVIGDSQFPSTLAPSQCINGGPSKTEEDTVAQFGANGIIGIGYFLQDCGAFCPSDGSVYSDCTTSSCTGYAAPTSEQILNPVPKFVGNNNGVAIQMQAVGEAQDAASGTLVFGVGAGAGSLPAGVKVYQVDSTTGYFSAGYNGASFTQSFIDTGSNAWYFPNQAPMLAMCAKPNDTYYCPTGGVAQLSATIHDFVTASNTAVVAFSIFDLSQYTNSTAAASGLAGLPGTLTNAFDFGSPFYFGKTVYIGFEGSTLGGTSGPAFAF